MSCRLVLVGAAGMRRWDCAGLAGSDGAVAWMDRVAGWVGWLHGSDGLLVFGRPSSFSKVVYGRFLYFGRLTKNQKRGSFNKKPETRRSQRADFDREKKSRSRGALSVAGIGRGQSESRGPGSARAERRGCLTWSPRSRVRDRGDRSIPAIPPVATAAYIQKFMERSGRARV